MFEWLLENVYLLTGIVSIMVIAVLTATLYVYSRRPLAIILRKQHGIYVVAKKIRLNPTSEKFTWGEKSYHVDWEKTSYLNPRNPVLFYIEGQFEPVNLLEKRDAKPDTISDKAYLLFKKETFRQLLEASKPLLFNWSFTILIMALSIGVGFAFGYVLYPYIHPQTYVPPPTNQTAPAPSPPIIPTP